MWLWPIFQSHIEGQKHDEVVYSHFWMLVNWAFVPVLSKHFYPAKMGLCLLDACLTWRPQRYDLFYYHLHRLRVLTDGHLRRHDLSNCVWWLPVQNSPLPPPPLFSSFSFLFNVGACFFFKKKNCTVLLSVFLKLCDSAVFLGYVVAISTFFTWWMLGNPVVCMTRGGFFRLFYAPGFRKSCCVLPVLSSASPSYFQSMCLKHMRQLAVVGFVFTCFHVVVGFNFTCFHVSWDQAAHYGWSVKLVWCQDVSSVEVLAEAEIPGGEGRGRPYLTLHCHHQN